MNKESDMISSLFSMMLGKIGFSKETKNIDHEGSKQVKENHDSHRSSQREAFSENTKEDAPRFWLGHHSILSKKWKKIQSTESWFKAALYGIFYEFEKKVEIFFQKYFFSKKKFKNFLKIFFSKKKFQIFFSKFICK